MENVHNAIAWYQKKIGSYDKQLWEQSVEKKLQKQPPFVLHNAPRKKVRLKTEYIDVDLIRGSTFAKAKPQVPWVYITRKAVARVMFFPFYYNWWVHQTSKQLYAILLVLYVFQVVTIIVYLRNFDHSIMEDVGIAEELSFTEVILPTILMFLLCLIHSQTVLAHISHKPPKRTKTISGVTRKARPKKVSRKGRTSGNNSTCPEDGGNTDTSKSSKSRNPGSSENQAAPSGSAKPDSEKVDEPAPCPLDMEKNLMSRAVSDYDLKPVTSSTKNVTPPRHDQPRQTDRHLSFNDYRITPSESASSRSGAWGHGRPDPTHAVHKTKCSHNLLASMPNVLTVEKVCRDIGVQSDNDTEDGDNDVGVKFKKSDQRLGRDSSSHRDCGVQFNTPSHVTHTNSAPVGCVCHTPAAHVSFASCTNTTAQGLVSHKVHKNSSSPGPVTCACNTHPTIQVSHARHVNSTSPGPVCSVGHPAAVDQVSPVSHTSSTVRGGACADNYEDCDCLDVMKSCSSNERLQEERPDSHSGSSSLKSATQCHESSCSLCFNDGFVQCSVEPSDSLHERGCGSLDKSPDRDLGLDKTLSSSPERVGPATGAEVDLSPLLSKHTELLVSNSSSGVADVGATSSDLAVKKCQHCHDTDRDLCYQNLHPCTAVDSKLAARSRSAHAICVSNRPSSCCSRQNGFKQPSFKPNHVKFFKQDCEPPYSRSCPDVSSRPPTCLEQAPQPAQQEPKKTLSETSSQLQCFSDEIVQEILNQETLREMSCSSLLQHSDLENSSSSFSHLSNSSSSISSLSSSYRIDRQPVSSPSSLAHCLQCCPHHHMLETQSGHSFTDPHMSTSRLDNLLDESLEQINMSDGERPSDVSNYNPSDSDAESDAPIDTDALGKLEEKWKRLRFQEQDVANEKLIDPAVIPPSLLSKTGVAPTKGAASPRSVVGILTRKPSPLKDLAIGRVANNSSGSEAEVNDSRNQLRRRRRASGTTGESSESRGRNVPNSLGLHASDGKHVSSSENEAGAHTPEGSNKATMSSEEWEDHMQSDETTSSAYSSSCGGNSDSGEEEEKTDYTTSTLHVINLLQPGLQPGCLPQSTQTANGLLPPGCTTNASILYRKIQQSGSPTSSGTITQPDKVSCVIWEGNDCKKVDLTALDIGWAIIDKVDSLPESSDYFLIGLLFSVLMGLVPLVFRIFVNKETARWEDFVTWSGLLAQLSEIPALICNTYSWRQYLLMINGILQRFFLSLIFFFLLSVADRTFKQRLLYAKHFSYLTSSRRARKFSMPHFRLNKVRNIKIWLSLRSYLKRRGPQRSVDVIVSACFLCAICTVCLISLQMLKETESYLYYLCNWELMVWCIALGVFLMRFMTVGLKINKKYRNLSVLITEQINLYLQMEQKPHKKEELILANNVLRLAEDLLKELESPFKISGFSANPLIYNIMRVVVLSAFSAVLTEVLGFKLKLHKIKLKG
ncbi:uncharacterized protein LOC131928402 isoform X2 [Physella acuta]|uniref:uncharacterized protein LOC131928402 isoform X2 n=1 Tax=Physella acuta TaxID=109671 RepID=UPI0027DC97CF|nr:uncharacterized protein LOC131928402 isoform X2 [Physella acuta]